MIGLYTDFGYEGPYIGQIIAEIEHYSSAIVTINIQSDLPSFDIEAASILLAAYHHYHIPGNVYICVVDPGVGTEQRMPVVVRVDDVFYVGPNNGIFDRIIAHKENVRVSEIIWRPSHLSNSFHGRDLFAPIAAKIEDDNISVSDLQPIEYQANIHQLSVARIVYIDHFGNCITGLFASDHPKLTQIKIGRQIIHRVKTFADVRHGEPLLYENSSGLLEVAINQGNASKNLQIQLGMTFELA